MVLVEVAKEGMVEEYVGRFGVCFEEDDHLL